ncbi:hypothetical protein KG112_14595 [Nocardioides sp. zg-ZUI104]|uniref:hypothetical protein n=1 Tax=Nocardioides faecalis TaxID=2803858 RepID=UPI001BCE72F8|nr:hypothetical protein [Nocardioides faecalis]MBS4754040.1 hypothetical protein [Nocardioides faecalis]
MFGKVGLQLDGRGKATTSMLADGRAVFGVVVPAVVMDDAGMTETVVTEAKYFRVAPDACNLLLEL